MQKDKIRRHVGTRESNLSSLLKVTSTEKKVCGPELQLSRTKIVEMKDREDPEKIGDGEQNQDIWKNKPAHL